MNETLSTKKCADKLNVKPATIYSGYCNDGHYCGIVPVKLPNRFLLWKESDIAKVLNGGIEPLIEQEISQVPVPATETVISLSKPKKARNKLLPSDASPAVENI